MITSRLGDSALSPPGESTMKKRWTSPKPLISVMPTRGLAMKYTRPVSTAESGASFSPSTCNRFLDGGLPAGSPVMEGQILHKLGLEG